MEGRVVNLNLDNVFKYTVFFFRVPLKRTARQQYLSCSDQIFTKFQHPEHIPTVPLKFVQATYVRAIFVHINNIYYWNDLTKLFRPNFIGVLILENIIFLTQIFLGPKNFLDLKIC